MLVSIIVITYNSSKYVLDTLESCNSQSILHPPSGNLKAELIISDDCSTDNTVAICSKWVSEHKGCFVRTVVTKTPTNQGICGNYNHARALAHGEWIKYIAGDDMLKPNCIERFAANIQPGTELYFSDAERINAEGRCSECWHCPLVNTSSGETTKSEAGKQLRQMLRYHSMIPGPAIFVNSKALEDVDGFDERFPMSEDYPIVMRFLTHGKPVHIISEPLVQWRAHSDSVSVNYTTSGFSLSVKESVLYYTKKYCWRHFLFGIHYHEWLTIWIREHQGIPFLRFFGYFLRGFDFVHLKRKIFPAPKWVEIKHNA